MLCESGSAPAGGGGAGAGSVGGGIGLFFVGRWGRIHRIDQHEVVRRLLGALGGGAVGHARFGDAFAWRVW